MRDGTRMPEPKVTTRVPRVFGPWGTLCYGISAAISIVAVLAIGIAKWTPPWYLLMPAFLYVFVSAGAICWGRIESNKDAEFFIRALRARSDENERHIS